MTEKGPSRRPENKIYANALPLVPVPSLYAGPILSRVLGPSTPLARASISNPHCVGVFDEKSRSVWITSARDIDILWKRGFFGKGNLSRSEPTWLNRRINQLNGVKVLTAEELTAKRREERKLFKTERAQAIAAAAAEAEARFATEGRPPTPPVENISTAVRANLAAQKASTPHLSTSDPPPPLDDPPPDEGEEPEGSDRPENMEHLQLTLQEAFFLSWGLDCLDVLDPITETYLTREQAWQAYLAAHTFPIPPSLSQHRRFDNPFLVHYVVYHHFRSLGWVIKSGLKFCTDYLLYKRGPVFTHAEFSLVVCPTYEDPGDEQSSPFDLPNTKPISWSWLSTLNRVNTQVRKSLMLVYVTIPAMKRVPLESIDSPAVLQEYTIREVTIKRFVPARMRD
ncbi:hypothetical protein BS47DRAFT_1346894 [Hydnum rufescens UP504]|uniref:tRNA-splicing endonuclease subunit Sen2 n=1 Tax=Hydnum rufescens UP504 TaxID=1448309 RepID=A0A9P6ASY5_9AGAM|nr:hypothetical protein BS47DRAFT_1346894 [Hydnum rufescens UP504]